MPIYLVEDEVGFDADLVGFPNLGGCMALVLQVEEGLFGFHVPPGHGERVAGFKTYCEAHPSFGTKRHLYGSCYWNNRYAGLGNQFFQWHDEMSALAVALGYVGPISGFNTSAVQTGIGMDAATYLEVRRVATTHACSIHYSNMTNITAPKTVSPDTEVRRLDAAGAATVPYLNKVVTSVAVQAAPMVDVTRNFGFYSVG